MGYQSALAVNYYDDVVNYTENRNKKHKKVPEIGYEDLHCRYGDKMYIVRHEEPVFIGYFYGKVPTSLGPFYIIELKGSFGSLEAYLPGCVKSERELILEKVLNNS